MKVYVDSEHHCHTANPEGAFREVESVFFDDKCTAFIEGYCYDDSEGFTQIYPWKDYTKLAAAQAQYELMMAEAAAAYREGVDSVD